MANDPGDVDNRTLGDMKKESGQPKSKRTRPRTCMTVNAPFDTRKEVEMVLYFDCLKNFKLENPALPGQYVIRVACMGETYGHFASQSLAPNAHDAFGDGNSDAPDIIIDEEIVCYVRFKDLVDNPILLSLCDTTGTNYETYEELQPIAFISLDIPRIFNFQNGLIDGHIEPWIIPHSGVQNPFLVGPPMIKVSLEIQTGMPSPFQLGQGNILTVFLESMSHLPDELVPTPSPGPPTADSGSDTNPTKPIPINDLPPPNMQVMITLPHSDKIPILSFPGGRIGSRDFVERPVANQAALSEGTQTGDDPTSDKNKKRIPLQKHWATVQQFWEDLPFNASAMSASEPLSQEEVPEVIGDAIDSYKRTFQGSCSESMIIWDSQHRKFISVEAFKQMLTRLSKNVMWPLEVAITLKKANKKQPLRTPKKKPPNSRSSGDPLHTASSQSVGVEVEESEDPETLYMNDLGKTNINEIVLLYHGIAFVDLSQLVYPGVQKIRVASRLHPYSLQLLTSKSCFTKSAFSDYFEGKTVTRSSDMPKLASEASLIGGSHETSEDCLPFIVLEISLNRPITQMISQPTDVTQMVNHYIPPREIPRRKLINAAVAQHRLRRSFIEAAAEVTAEFNNHYWKDVILSRKNSNLQDPSKMDAESIKKGFIFYLNATGRYLVIREHLRQAVSQIVQQRCLNLRPSGFQTHKEFQSFLQDMYIYLADEVHETLSRTSMQEVDPLEPVPILQSHCAPNRPAFMKNVEEKVLLRDLLFYSEESLVQGDYDNCHRLHLQRICRSKEDPECWVDFSLMWLTRGDDRMAEIASQEALRKDPKNVQALLICGIIAVKHNDPKGIDCLTSALSLKPFSPEINVILAMAYASTSNEFGSDYFFRRAAYLHTSLTGLDSAGIDAKFDMINKTIGVKHSVRDIYKAQKFINDKPVPTVVLPEPRNEVSDDTPMSKKNSKRRSSRSSRGSRGSIEHPKAGSTSDPRRQSQMSKRKSSAPSEEVVLEGKRSLNRNSNPNKPTGSEDFSAPLKDHCLGPPRFDFVPDISEITWQGSIVPPLRPSISIPWNVTEFDEKLKSLVQPSAPPSPIQPSTRTGTGETNLAADEVIKAEYDKIIKRQSLKGDRVSSQGSKVSRASGGPTNSMLTIFGSLTGNEEEEGGAYEDEEEGEMDDYLKSAKSVKEVKSIVAVNRLGSELIWTAQLLLHLRMFDMLDGVLSRELYVTGKRSIQFLYLRAMALYLRKIHVEALSFLDETLELYPENAALWMLHGHCFYELGRNSEAMQSYEAALALPVGKENRHLLYLRYGSLALDAQDCELGKKIFLHGIQKYPTPYMWLATGNTCYILQDLVQAEAAFAEANRLDNTNPITWAHLALINLAQGQKVLAEQSYKWALRFGLKKGKILDEIQKLQEEKGFGDPSFPRIPNCIPHDYYVRRLGRQRPFDIYRDALLHEPPTLAKKQSNDDTDLQMNLESENTAEKLTDSTSVQNTPISPSQLSDEEEMDPDIRFDKRKSKTPVGKSRKSKKSVKRAGSVRSTGGDLDADPDSALEFDKNGDKSKLAVNAKKRKSKLSVRSAGSVRSTGGDLDADPDSVLEFDKNGDKSKLAVNAKKRKSKLSVRRAGSVRSTGGDLDADLDSTNEKSKPPVRVKSRKSKTSVKRDELIKSAGGGLDPGPDSTNEPDKPGDKPRSPVGAKKGKSKPPSVKSNKKMPQPPNNA